MRPISIITRFVFYLSLFLGLTFGNAFAEDIHDLPLSSLEARLASIDSELKELASYSLRTGIGAVGFRSNPHTESKNTEWIQIDMEEVHTIDQIVLVPVIWRDTKSGFRADGFPLEFKILAGTSQNDSGQVIAQYGETNQLIPRIAPLLIPCPRIKASWIRLEATQLSARAWDEKFLLQLDEILIFSDQENLALRKPVTTSSSGEPARGARDKRYLVDGFVPYLMDAFMGEQSIAFFSSYEKNAKPEFIIDLGEVYPLNRLHLHTTELSDTIPQPSPPGLAIPKKMKIEGATKRDFSDAKELVEYQPQTIFDSGPIIMRRFPETNARYIRIFIEEPYQFDNGVLKENLVGFAEIELFSDGKNVALGKSVEADRSSILNTYARTLTALTDGHNLYGQILPLKDWLGELAKRHDLEVERPLIVAELNDRYLQQKVNLDRLKWLAVLLAISIVVIVLMDRIFRMRQVAGIKERLAADLHDELGADLHTIGLLSDLAEDARNSPEELSMLHQRIRRVTEQTGTAVRHCTNMLEANGYNTNVADTIRRASRRIMAKLENEISIEGEEDLNKLKPRTRFDLVLFYNECLVNISRHSGATKFRTQLTADPKNILLSVWDNGRGLSGSKVNEIPKSLKRRARLLGAKVGVVSPDSGGTCINLQLRTRKWGRRK